MIGPKALSSVMDWMPCFWQVGPTPFVGSVPVESTHLVGMGVRGRGRVRVRVRVRVRMRVR